VVVTGFLDRLGEGVEQGVAVGLAEVTAALVVVVQGVVVVVVMTDEVEEGQGDFVAGS
jgi:hypothetical protein